TGRGRRSSRCWPSSPTSLPWSGRSAAPRRPRRPAAPPARRPDGARRVPDGRGGIVLALLAGLAAAAPALALNFFERAVCPATTGGKGMHEIESTSSYVANGRSEAADEGDEPPRNRLLRTSLEYDYGLTDRIDVAAYLDLQHPNGGEVEYAGSRFRARGALWEKGEYPVDLGWYVEAEVPHDTESQLELEFRP